ncbi:MAG TPA: YfiR family protein [Candidatus Methylomirabilis sp.]|nr:YfiR family protein [Candidatus Methylomirabilis sp.]
MAGLLLIATMGMAPVARGETPPDEYHVKAAFLYNFAKFIEWPDEKAGSPGDFPLCVLGSESDPVLTALDSLQGKTVRGLPLTTRRVATLGEARTCRILFVTSSERPRLPEILSALRGRPVLTVGDTNGFAERGGIINLVKAGNRISFEINTDAAQRAGLTMSSKLLFLGKIVKPGVPAGD